MRRCLRVVDGGHDRPVGRRRELLPAHLRRRRGSSQLGAHPDVRLARGRRRHAPCCAARAQARRGRRGAGDRGRAGVTAVLVGAQDVHPPRRRRRADRRQRRAAARQARALPRRPERRLAPERGRPRRPPQAVRDRRRGRLDRRGGDRGPLPQRRVPRRDDARDRRRRAPGAGGVPDELHRSRRAAAGRPAAAVPAAGRRGDDPDRAGAGDPGRARRGVAGDRRADRRRARAPRRHEPLLHRRRDGRADPGGGAAGRARADRRRPRPRTARRRAPRCATATASSSPRAQRCGSSRARSSTPRS